MLLQAFRCRKAFARDGATASSARLTAAAKEEAHSGGNVADSEAQARLAIPAKPRAGKQTPAAGKRLPGAGMKAPAAQRQRAPAKRKALALATAASAPAGAADGAALGQPPPAGVPELLGDAPLRLVLVGHNPSDHAWCGFSFHTLLPVFCSVIWSMLQQQDSQ